MKSGDMSDIYFKFETVTQKFSKTRKQVFITYKA